jgi:FkbM family methyltransferase
MTKASLNLEKLIKSLPAGRRTFCRLLIPLLPKSMRAFSANVEDLCLEIDMEEFLDREYFFGEWDREEVNFLSTHYEMGTHFVDIGANQGFYSLYLAKKHPAAKILAIEPDPYHIRKLRTNIENNGIDNITICEHGVSDEPGNKLLMLNVSGNRGANSMVHSQKLSTEKGDEITIEVPCKTLLQTLLDNRVAKVSCLKIDIEGYEYSVLNRFFEDAPKECYPKIMVVEAFGYTIPLVGGSVIELCIHNGYHLINHNFPNYFFRLV